MNTITLTIPTDWLGGLTLSQEQLRQAMLLGLQQLQQPENSQQIIHTLLSTGRVRRHDTSVKLSPSTAAYAIGAAH